MADFVYRAADAAGMLLDGTCEAPDRDAAARQLRSRGLTPIKVESTGSANHTVEHATSTTRRESGGRIRPPDVLALTTELSIMLRAGLSLDSALRVLIGMTHKRAVSALLEDVLEAVKGGATLSKALATHRQHFGDFYLNMVRSGEAGGHLADILARLVEHLERMRALRDSVISATIYPAILLVVAVLSVIAMLGFVVPQFEAMFTDLGDALPMPTRIVLELGGLFTDYGLYGAIVCILVGAVVVRWATSPAGTAWLQHRLLRVPLLGAVALKYEVTRFVRSFGTLLSNGVPILGALDIARDTVGNHRLRTALSSVTPAMKGGGRLAEALRDTGLFEPLAVNLIKVGEETGRLDAMLLEIARIFDRDVETAIKRALTMLEPLLILTLGLLIAAIIVSILMGILSINDLAI